MTSLVAFAKVPIPPEILGQIEYISSGSCHNFLICKNNIIYACGYNELGQLGISSNEKK